MFDMTPYFIWHTFLSIMLHVAGVLMGLYIWYLFPRNPLKHVTRMPLERRGLLIEYENEIIDGTGVKNTRMFPNRHSG